MKTWQRCQTELLRWGFRREKSGGFGGQSGMVPRDTVAAPQMRRQLSLNSVHRSLGGGNLGTQLNTRSAPRGPPRAR